MFDRNLSKILARCLADVETGRLSVEECLRQHPEHAVELRRHLELHEHLAGVQRPDPSVLGTQRGRQQLLTAVAGHNIEGVPRKMIPNLLSSAIAKAIAGTLVGAIFLAGAAGASAAMGGPNVPGQALAALGLDGNHNDNGNNATTPNTQDLFGLCNAWSQGSAKGQENKRDATAFQALIKAAGAEKLDGQALEEKMNLFCDKVVKPGQTPTQTGNKPDATPTPPVDHPTGRPDATPTPPVDHPTGRPDGIPPVTH